MDKAIIVRIPYGEESQYKIFSKGFNTSPPKDLMDIQCIEFTYKPGTPVVVFFYQKMKEESLFRRVYIIKKSVANPNKGSMIPGVSGRNVIIWEGSGKTVDHMKKFCSYFEELGIIKIFSLPEPFWLELGIMAECGMSTKKKMSKLIKTYSQESE